MTLTVTKQPEKLMLSKNPIVLGLHTDNKYSSAGTKSVSKIQFLGAPPADGDFFSVEVDGVTYGYVFKDDGTASATALEINRNNSALYATISAWVAGEVIPAALRTIAIRDNYDLTITYDGTFYYLNFTDKTYNADHIISIGTSSTQLNYSNTAGTERVARDNYKLYCDVWATRNADGTGFEKVTSLEADPDDAGNAEFNIDRVLVIEDNEMPTDLGYSDTDAKVTKRYKLFYGEKYGDPVVNQASFTLGQTSPLFALNGALSEDLWPYYSFYTKTANANPARFLNLHPRIMTVSRVQPLWLYYFYNHTSGGWRLKHKAYKVDGSTTITTVSTSAENHTNQVLAINVSASDMGGDDEDIYKYQVWLEKQDGTVISETITYIFSDLVYEHNRYFIYRNSWGCYETIWCHGKADYVRNFDFQQAQVYVPPTSTTAKPASKIYGLSFEKTVNVSTGIKGREDKFDGKAYRDYLVDFYCSEERYEIINGKMLPIELQLKDMDLGADDDTIFSSGFKYKYSFKDKGFTPSWL